VSPARAIALRAFADARARTISFALLFLFTSAAVVVGYRSAYPTRADRLEFARSIGDTEAVRLLYGVPRDLLTVGGYAGWRLVGSLTILASLWGVLAAVRALRAEEEAGRQELVMAGVVSRRAAFVAALAAIAGGAFVLWLALLAGVMTARLSVGASAYLALTIVSTPLGWAEELRAFADPRPLVLLLPAITAALLLVAAERISVRRDVGAGLLAAHDSAEPRLRLLSSPEGLAVRTLRGGFYAWLGGIGVYAVIMGVVSDSVASGLSESLQEQLEKLGAVSADTPTGFLGFAFLFFVLAISLFGPFQLGAVREEEAEQRLETLLAQPVSRPRWLAGRLALASVGAAVLGLAAGVLAWVGAVSAGADVSFASLLEAGLNCLPVALLFVGLGSLAVAAVPRAGVAIAYALVAVAFVWETVGGLLDAPGWLLDISPFHQVALVPAEPFAATAATVMVGAGLAAALAATAVFRRRDLLGP
jgi:ABC-2 type transport system permease protein